MRSRLERNPLRNPVLIALRKAQAAKAGPDSGPNDGQIMRLQEASAIEAYRCGKPTAFDTRVLQAVLEVTTRLARQGVGPEALPDCNRVAAWLARYSTGTPCCDVQPLQDLLAWSDAQQAADPAAYKAEMLPYCVQSR